MTQSFDLLAGHKYMNLTTFRKNGEPKPTPVWFTEANGKLYVVTEPETWKVKRMKNNPNVEFTPCKMEGTLLSDKKGTGTARFLSAAEEAPVAKLFKKKYGLFNLFLSLRGKLQKKTRVYIEITPEAETLPI